MDQNYARLQTFNSLYLSPNDADVWFLIDGERIPSHKLILTAMSEYYKTMFYGSMPETGEINMNESNISAESFKEFLKFIYLVKPNLTMDNIEGVINMAKISLSDDIFVECEKFLKNSISKDTLVYGYQLALQYDMIDLRALCEEDICVHIESALKSKYFLQFPYEFLQVILKSDSLACEEKDVFNACIVWGKAACKRNCLNPKNMEHLRDQLGDSLYQIRFTSMTNHDAAACIGPYRGLFTRDELQEIICMVGHNRSFEPKQFNWKPRYFSLNWDKGEYLECSRFTAFDNGKRIYKVERCEVTRFTCNRRIILCGFDLELASHNSKSIQIKINEINSNERSDERHNQRITARFFKKNKFEYDSFSDTVRLDKWILLRPNYMYEISITFDHQMVDMASKSTFKSKVRINHDIVLKFSNRGIVSALSIRRFDSRGLIRKVVHNPWLWLLLMMAIAIGCSGASLYVWPSLGNYIINHCRNIFIDTWSYALLMLYVIVCILLVRYHRDRGTNES